MSELLKLTSNVALHARPAGIVLTGVTESTAFSDLQSEDPSIQAFLSRLPGLISDGIFLHTDEGLHASIEMLANLELHEHDPLAALFRWSPYALKIHSTGTLGFEDFRFVPRFYLGTRLIPLKLLGIFGWRSKAIVRLPATQAAAVLICNEFNNHPLADRDKWATLRTLYELQLLAQNGRDVELDSYLKSENVVMPQRIELGVEDDGHFLTAFPRIEGVPDAEIKKQFLNMSEAQSVYDLEVDSGRRRVLLSPELQNVFRAIKKHGFGLTGKKREEFYRNPRQILPEDESCNPDLIELVGFGPRVKGIGYPQFVRPVMNHAKENWFNRNESESTPSGSDQLAIECEFIDGSREVIEFDKREKADAFVTEMKAALVAGHASFEWEGNAIPVSESLLNSCEMALDLNSSEPLPRNTEDRRTKALLIHTNEDAIDYSEETSNREETWKVQIPRALRSDKKLKDHQVAGLHWLQNLIHNDLAKGGLLADEMGLGKTLQLLSLAAWCIETEFKEQLGKDTPPYDPVLIVAPLILVEVWAKEIQEYFDSSIFQPFDILHGPKLKSYRTPSSGRELEGGKDTLDLERLRKNRLIITNYDTIKNYQYSFAKVPWGLVIVDEAQEIKEPSTSITHALKALNPLFRIASTGTPVETSLTNLWSIMDFVQPGNALGSLTDFNKQFSGKEVNDTSIGEQLRERLSYNRDRGLVKRRTKREVLKDLPEKHFIVQECHLDDVQRDLYLQIVASVKASKNPQAAALQGLQQISVLTQHPFLVESNPFRSDHEEYLRASSKLRSLVDILHTIQGKGEKALIFTRSRAMQDIIKVVLDRVFKIDVKIVNGSTTSRHQYVSKTRSGIIDSFSKADGFRALILSPEVAGVGLTITAANHVIHYGRWWNPAKENQATDRAYRIGQVRPVYVYHLIAKDPQAEFESFDEKLDRLLKSREELADNFLAPGSLDSDMQDGLAGDIFSRDDTKSRDTSRGRNALSSKSIQQLTPFEFEALTALLLSNRFEKTVLTPRTRDGGVDVLGVGKHELALIQCKHRTINGETNAEDAISELIDGLDFYRESVIPKALKHLPVRLILALSGKPDTATVRSVKAASIELLDGAGFRKLLDKAALDALDIAAMEDTRVRDLEHLSKAMV